MSFFEYHVTLRLSVLLGYIISNSSPFLDMVNYFLQPGVFGFFVKLVNPMFSVLYFILSELLFPLKELLNLIHIMYRLLRDLVSPLVSLAFQIIKLPFSLLKLILYMPTLSMYKLFLLIKDAIVNIYLFIRGVFMVRKVIVPVAKTTIENRDTTLSIIYFFQ